MADAISVDAAIPGDADKTITFSAGKLAGQADGAVTVRIGDTVMLVTAIRGQECSRRCRLLPPHRGHRGADVRRRSHPRFVLPT